jgi:hypothetical protein
LDNCSGFQTNFYASHISLWVHLPYFCWLGFTRCKVDYVNFIVFIFTLVSMVFRKKE